MGTGISKVGPQLGGYISGYEPPYPAVVYVRFELGSAQTWPYSNATRAARKILLPRALCANVWEGKIK